MTGPWTGAGAHAREDDRAVHTLLTLLIALIIAAACLGILVAGVATARMAGARRRNVTFRRRFAPGMVEDEIVGPAGAAVVVLDVDPPNRPDPAVERLVEEAAAGAFRSHPDAVNVEVRSPSGAMLGRRSRNVLPAHVRSLHGGSASSNRGPREPHVTQSRAPDVSRHLKEEPLTASPSWGPSRPEEGGVQPAVRRPLVTRFELPEAVTARIEDPDDPVGLVEALLTAGGGEVMRDGDLLRTGDLAVVVLPVGSGVWVSRHDLNHAFLRIESSGAARGLVISFGHLDRDEVRTREAVAPYVLHAGPRDIQRMADAVAVGADPIRFARGTLARG